MKELSDHLFWDVDRAGIDLEHNAAWLAKRVLEHGRWADWQILVTQYGKPKLAELVTGLRSLQPTADQKRISSMWRSCWIISQSNR